MKRIIRCLVCALVLLGIPGTLCGQYGHYSQMVIVINPLNPREEIYRMELKNIFLQQKSYWDDGSPILLVVQEDPIHRGENFTLGLIGLGGKDFRESVLARIAIGGRNIIKVANDRAAIAEVKKRKGAIAYVRDISVDDLDLEVKKITPAD
jgi:ABC-type phosphate transport system substrate-binding protein